MAKVLVEKAVASRQRAYSSKCPPLNEHDLCVLCERNLYACDCKADPVGTTYARCTSAKCGKVYRLYPTRSRICEHCNHTPVEVLDPDDQTYTTREGFLTAKGPTAAELAAELYGDGRGPDGTGSIDEDTPCNCGEVPGSFKECPFHYPEHPKVLTVRMDPRGDEDFDPDEPIECLVNGKLCALPRESSYREVVTAAGYDGERVLSVTYRKGKYVGGILHVGEPILIEAKMIFNVADTSNA